MPNVLVLWKVASDRLFYIVAQALKLSLYMGLCEDGPRKCCFPVSLSHLAQHQSVL